jgi:hypothetical protein
MQNSFFRLFFFCSLILSLLVTCNDPEPEQISVNAVIPEVITYTSGVHHADTFKFHIESVEAVIDSVRLFESDEMYIGLGTEQLGADNRGLTLNFLYAPNSPGTKQFVLKIKAPPYFKNYSFSVDVIESN